MTARDRALNKIVLLRRLADHPNTPAPEAEAARTRIKVLMDKHGIEAMAEPVKQSRKAYKPWDEWYAEYQATAESRAAEEAVEKVRRRKAAEEWTARHDKEQRPWAYTTEGKLKDPFDEALRRDGRTHAEKQQDMQDTLLHKKNREK